ncbi:hypothetical protein [Labrys wisconsinensis]|uniref:DUF3035 domain-containing protein n=1 Tax=Labrys wisconsinensis TaxID=425677 RepID=A0ABU0J330_9HYPH|nr:hypothetical protein [Labrys wisconsinensis]MDQ0468668.1 hypothetical protein [Labrys wisconsinensis]
MPGRAFPTLPILLAALALAGCETTGGPDETMFGLRHGPLPSPQPFVVDSRGAVPPDYPSVGAIPPARQDKVLSVPERKALEDDLKNHQDKSAIARDAASTPKQWKKKKPKPEQTPQT